MSNRSYTHKIHSRARSLKLRVLSDGKVQVTTPRWTPKWQISKFVEDNSDWIDKQLAKQPKKQDKYQVPERVALFGKEYAFSVKYDEKLAVGFHIVGTHLLLNPVDPEHADGRWRQLLQDKLDRFLKKTAASFILPRTKQLAHKMNLSYSRVSLKEQSSRWGSCSSKRNLNFNWRLVHSPPEVIDYVIIHELCHLTEMNHSRAFWNLVEKYDPGYKLHRGWLKRNGHSMNTC